MTTLILLCVCYSCKSSVVTTININENIEYMYKCKYVYTAYTVIAGIIINKLIILYLSRTNISRI